MLNFLKFFLLLFITFFTIYVFAIPRSCYKKHSVPGAAIAQIDKEQIQYFCIGYAGREKKVETKTLFQLASISKTFFSVAVLRWVKINNFSLDSQISSLNINNSILNLDEHWEQITLRELLSHRSGLNKINYPGYSNEHPPSLFESMHGVAYHHPKLSFSKNRKGKFNYSGGGYSLLQFVIEKKMEINFEKFMKTFLLDPWDIKNCVTEFNQQFASSYASPHNFYGKPVTMRSFTEKAAAGIYSNVSNVALFIKNLLHSENTVLLESMRNTLAKGYGLGIEIESLNHNTELLYHFGANIGWRAGVFLVPQLNKGFVVLTNGEGGYPFICDLVEEWLTGLKLDKPSFIQSKKLGEKIILFLCILFGIIGINRGMWMAFQIFQHKKYLLLSKKRLFILFSLGILIIVWYFFFFTPYLPPYKWIIAAYMPFRFIKLSQILLMCVFVESIYLITKNYRDSNADKKY